MDTSEDEQSIPIDVKKVAKTSSQDRSWVWLLGLFSFACMIESFFFSQLRAFTPLYLPSLGIFQNDVARWTGIIASITGLIGVPFLPLWGALADRYQRKPIIVRSYVVYLLVAALLLMAGNIWVFLSGWVVSSLALGNTGLMLATLTEHTPVNRQGLAIALMSSMASIGGFIGPILGGPIVDHTGFRSMVFIGAGLILLVVIAMLVGFTDGHRGASRGPLLKMAGDSVKTILTSAHIRSFFLALFFMFAGLALAQTYVPLAVQTLYAGQDPGTVVGLVVGASSLAAFIINPLFGLVSDRFGHWRILLLGAAIEVLLWPLPALVKGILPFAVVWALISGISSAVFSIALTVLSHSTEDEIRGRVMSFAYLPANLGSFFGPTIGSVLTRSTVFAVFPAAAGFVLVGILVFMWVRSQDRLRKASTHPPQLPG